MNQEKFIKLMMLTQSNNNHESLSALRKANAMLLANGLNWETYLSKEKTKPKREWWNQETTPEPDLETETMLRVCLSRVKGSALEFIQSLETHYKLRSYLTPKQKSALKKFYFNCN